MRRYVARSTEKQKQYGHQMPELSLGVVAISLQRTTLATQSPTQSMPHFLVCLLCPNTCMMEDLNVANDEAIAVATHNSKTME